MEIFTRIKEWLLHLSGGKRLGDNPHSDRYMFINSEEFIRRSRIDEYKVWYIGDGDEIQNFYTVAMVKNWNYDTTFNRNRRLFFWAISVEEDMAFKRVHSGLPHVIVDNLVSAIGAPKFDGGTETERLASIIERNNLMYTIMQRQMPLTLVEGCGAFKPNIGKGIGFPTVSYYEAQDVDFAYKDDILQGVAFRDYFKSPDCKKDYVLVERREAKEGNTYINYNLYEMTGEQEGEEVPLSTLPQTAELQSVEIDGIGVPLAVPSVFFDDPLHPHMGRSIYQGMVDKFDELDMAYTMRSRTTMKSDPIEYVPSDLIPVDKDGKKGRLSAFNREYVEINGVATGDGKTSDQIQVTQPELNFQQYTDEITALTNEILIGVMSPASLGIDISKRDNADAQREKEKTTILTRNNIIASEMRILSQLGQMLLIMQDIIDTGGKVDLKDEHHVSVSFMEFANPSFENELKALGSAWKEGQISTSKFVDLVWRDKITEEEKKAEADWLDTNREQDRFAPAAYEGNNGAAPIIPDSDR